MKVLGILQCQYFNNPAHVRRMLQLNPGHDYRARFTKRTLFMGGKSGKMLMEHLGEDFCNATVWGEASPEIGGHHSACFPPDPAYVRSMVEFHRPEVVVAFGKVAEEAAKMAANNAQLPFWAVLHPASRNPHKVIASFDAMLSWYENLLSHAISTPNDFT